MKKKSLLFILLLAIFAPLAMNAQETLLSENFDSMTSLSTSYSATDWFAYNAGSGNNWTRYQSSSDAHSGSYSIRYNYNSSNAANCYLVSAPFTVNSKMAELSVSLYEKVASASYPETFEVFFVKASDVTSAATVATATHYDAIASASYTNTSYAEKAGSTTNPALAGQSVRVVVHCTSAKDMYRLFIDDITVTEELEGGCSKPTDFTVTYEEGTTATVTWRGEAKSYNIDVNGVVTEGVESPYILRGLEYNTTYTVKLQADCGDAQSAWTSEESFTTECGITSLPFFCGFENQSEYGCLSVYNTADNTGLNSSSDYVRTGSYSFVFAYNDAPPQYLFFPEFDGATAMNLSFYYKVRSSSYPETFQVGYSTDGNSFTWGEEVTATNASSWLQYEDTYPRGTKYIAISYNSNDQWALYLDDFNFTVASGCLKPYDLQASNVGTTSALLSWDGDNDSFAVQYRTAAQNINTSLWNQVGEDETATASLDTYTFDLSDYSGSGYIAIRHYNVTNQFRLALDNIVVTNESGTTIVSEDFESGSIPSTWTNKDVDGDGYTWAVIAFETPATYGDYSLVSDSWNSTAGALTPDNWMIIPVSELGGTLSFVAKGVDSNFPSEVFGVFVTTASLSDATAAVEAGSWSSSITTDETSQPISNLNPNTLYDWRVMGICGTEETAWVTSSFSTIAEGTKSFVTAGNWNVAENWFPVGVPTIDEIVNIQAAAIIPNGVVATAKKVKLDGGSVTIQDGGQLKQNGTVDVTMEKVITGYGDGNSNWYFIATPLTTTRLSYITDWAYVNALTGTYDLYAFDPTVELEWINYKNNSAHAEFTSGSNNPVLVSQKAYLYAHQDTFTLQFEGSTAIKSNGNTVSEDYEYDETLTYDYNGFKLVGNPYSCNGYLSFTPASGQTPTEVNFYVLNSAGDKFTLSESSVALAPCTGAFFYADADGAINFSSEVPATKARTGMLNISLTQEGDVVDMARIRFGEGMRLAKQSFRNDNSSIYIPQNDKNYAVIYTEATGEMPLNFKAETTGTHTISFKLDGASVDYLHLYDKLTGEDINLLITPEYSFIGSIIDATDRFVVRFSETTANSVFAYQSGNDIIVNGNGELQVFDIMGRMVMNTTVNGTSTVNLPSNAVYIFRMVGETVNTQKIVVR